MKKLIAIGLILLIAAGSCACTKVADDGESTSADVSAESADNHNHSHDVTDEYKESGVMYAVYSSNDSEPQTNVFQFASGDVTPEKIAAGLTGWTGLKFRISSETDSASNTVKIDWLADSTFVKGGISESTTSQSSAFAFDSDEEARLFMIYSLVRSIKANMGDCSVTFTADGKDISEMNLPGSLASDTVF